MIHNLLRKRMASKVIVTIFIVSLIPTVFNSLFFYRSASSVVKENVRESSLQIARQAADSLSFIFSNGSDMSDLIYSNQKIQNIVKADINGTASPEEIQDNQEYMTSFLNSNIYTSSFVRIIYILKEEGMSWGSGTFSSYKLSMYDIDQMPWAKKSVSADGELVWGRLQYDRLSGAGENTDLVLPITRVLKDFDNMNNIAYVQVSLDGNAILEKIDQIKLGKTGHFFVVDENAEIMIDSDLDVIGKPIGNEDLKDQILKGRQEFEFDENEVHHYGVMQPIGNGWYIVGVVPVTELTGEVVSMQHLIFFASLIFGILAILLGVILTRRVTEPVKVLTKQMKLVGEGDFNVRTKVSSVDEIGMMSNQFNHMINQVENLLERVKEEQAQKQEAELRAIKHRINPHFLFNTLSTIRWLVQFNQTERANTALSALSKLLEGNMGKTGTFISIKEELELVENFMVILQIRYQQKFNLQTEFEEGIENFQIPRMLLQPIVENAIFHGIVPTGKEGTVTITGMNIQHGVVLQIDDDGIGFEEDILEKINQGAAQINSFVGIGLNHVYDSVRLYYDPLSKVEITSTSEGTSVKLTLITKPGGGEDV
ncbi:sensor histidine kinase [Pseudalkalibacillus caeni]|uniref:Sensor histidine kinase n=1 Tax=Exobacillus caeni TaxID=2574798 RepID=A0A5R9F4D4_9BACL|nr:sensor histidine kinase [Pseudalkalibacillus caeni]TLS36498.1 sensor histidine kinase [Pseudalkalibacillus caeni]